MELGHSLTKSAIATHLMSKGSDVDFADYSGTARFDFLARLESLEIEIECKATSGDTSRKIPRQEVNRLADLILPTTQRLCDTPGCHRILITIPGRLGKSVNDLSRIASAVAAAAESETFVSNELARVDYTFDNSAPWPDPVHDSGAGDLFEKQFGLKNSHLLFHVSPGVAIVAVMITSLKADSVVDAISDQGKEAADQCSGTRPALVAVHLIDPIGRSELQTMLKTANGLHSMARAVFKDDRRLHVDSVAFTVPQLPRSDGHGATWLAGDLVILYNPKPQFPCDELRSIFRVSPPLHATTQR